MELRDRDLKLRHAVAADAPQLAKWWNDGEVMAHAGFPNGLGTTEEETARKLETDADGVYRRIIIEYSGRPIGEMSYRRVDGNAAEIGIKICEASEQNHGLGRRALSLLIGYLFGELRFGTVVLDTNLKNERARHVYESLGFRKVRISVDAWTDQVGQKQSSVDYELCPGDFVSFLP